MIPTFLFRLSACFYVLLAIASVNAADPVAVPGIPSGNNNSQLPTALSERIMEIHGDMAGSPFWARLHAADQQYGGKRMLELVYTPSLGELDGAQMSDCPFILCDEHLRLMAWNGRDTLNRIVPAAKPAGYRVTRELLAGTGNDLHAEPDERTIVAEPAWDLHIAPVLLALSWRPGSSASVRVVDFFGPRHGESLRIAWTDTSVDLAGTTAIIDAGTTGLLKSVRVGEHVLVTVSGRSTPE